MPINHVPISDDNSISNSKKNEQKKENRISFYITDPQNTFEDIILPETTKGKIDCFLSLTQNRSLIFEKWGLSSVIKHHNYNINLYGESGTGKTMTAHAIASALGKKLIIVNYAEIESKYVGETSKNLLDLFGFAQKSGAVILFDEADALLSKRVTSMHSATDVSVNQTRNVLLKILDDYNGAIIFTTNFIQNFDTAFLRRIFTHVKFELPDVTARKRLWEHYLVSGLPVVDRSNLINIISEYDSLSGADISTAVLKAAIDAANSKEKKISTGMLESIVKDIQESKHAITGNYEVTTRHVTEEYAMSKLNGGTINGNNK